MQNLRSEHAANRSFIKEKEGQHEQSRDHQRHHKGIALTVLISKKFRESNSHNHEDNARCIKQAESCHSRVVSITKTIKTHAIQEARHGSSIGIMLKVKNIEAAL